MARCGCGGCWGQVAAGLPVVVCCVLSLTEELGTGCMVVLLPSTPEHDGLG
jgi:hypothetical protein